jgi:hypothetical protein
MTDPQQQATGTLQLKTSFGWWMFILALFKPKLWVNGYELPLAGWGESAHQLYAGPNEVSVSFPYLFLPKAGEAKVTIQMPVGGIVRLEYRPPWLVFLPGKLTPTNPVSPTGF